MWWRVVVVHVVWLYGEAQTSKLSPGVMSASMRYVLSRHASRPVWLRARHGIAGEALTRPRCTCSAASGPGDCEWASRTPSHPRAAVKACKRGGHFLNKPPTPCFKLSTRWCRRYDWLGFDDIVRPFRNCCSAQNAGTKPPWRGVRAGLLLWRCGTVVCNSRRLIRRLYRHRQHNTVEIPQSNCKSDLMQQQRLVL